MTASLPLPLVMPVAAGFLLVLLRTAALCSVAPLFGARPVPGRVRLGIALGLALMAFTAAGSPPFASWDRTSALLGAAVAETLVGIAAGLAGRFAFEAVTGAGHLVSMGMGLGFSQVLDPINGSESTSLGDLLSLAALGVAVAAGLHREIVVWLCRSVVETPPGSALDLPALCGEVIAAALRAFALAVRLAFPVLAAVTFGHIAMGVLGRTVQQLAHANVGFSIAILAGGGAVYMVAPGLAEIAAQAARQAFVGR
jgi:flagellar biosynthetic protein FliR